MLFPKYHLILLTMQALRDFDSELWVLNTARIVQKPFRPQASRDPPVTRNGYILYRGVYYFSTNEECPYVGLKKNILGSFPLPACFRRPQTDIRAMANVDLAGLDLTVFPPETNGVEQLPHNREFDADV